MQIVRLEWDVPTVNTLLDNGFDYMKIEAERPSAPGTWVEITRQSLRIPLVEDMERYCFQDNKGTVDAAYAVDSNYRAVPWDSVNDLDDAPIAITEKYLYGYCTIQDIRDEGFAEAAWPAATVYRGIYRATTMIESICKQWFEPRFRSMVFNGPGHDRMLLDIPIIALMTAEQDNEPMDTGDFKVFNRHLTQGQNHPDDRKDPRIAYGQEYGRPGYRSTRARFFTRFSRGRKVLRFTGIYGYTELGPGDEIGETVEDSQIPLSLGRTPALITKAATKLTIRQMRPGSQTQNDELDSRITKVKTRDQEVSYAKPDQEGENTVHGLTGIEEVDYILMQFAPPIRIGAV